MEIILIIRGFLFYPVTLYVEIGLLDCIVYTHIMIFWSAYILA